MIDVWCGLLLNRFLITVKLLGTFILKDRLGGAITETPDLISVMGCHGHAIGTALKVATLLSHVRDYWLHSGDVTLI